MSKRVASGTKVAQGDWIGTMGSVGTGYPHLHYEQLFNPNSNLDGDTDNMVNPLIQGKGPLVMDPAHPITMVSTNTADTVHTTNEGAPHGTYFWVDIFQDAPVFKTPASTNRTGTLKAGRNYVFGKEKGREIRVGPNFNHFWLKTDPDLGQGHWVSAYYLTRWGNDEAKDNEGAVIPNV
jgi:murein DD-endopeptidase MepM/ murein hydrolase activator NlpD